MIGKDVDSRTLRVPSQLGVELLLEVVGDLVGEDGLVYLLRASLAHFLSLLLLFLLLLSLLLFDRLRCHYSAVILFHQGFIVY